MERGLDLDPLKQFDKDLTALISTSIRDGLHVVLGLDANEDLNKTTGRSFRALMATVSMQEAILTQHGNCKETCNRGSHPIDGIFVSPQLIGCKCGHAGWYSDHVLLYIDVPTITALGGTTPLLQTASARRLKLSDTRVVDNFNRSHLKHLKMANIGPRLQVIWNEAKQSYRPDSGRLLVSQDWITSYEVLDEEITSSLITAERSCRKLHMGNVPFSPEWQLLDKRTHFANALIAARRTGNHSWSHLRRLAKAVHLAEAFSWSLGKLKRKATEWRKEKKEFKQTDRAWLCRDSHIERLATSNAEKNGTSAASVLRRMLNQEHHRRDHAQIRFALKKPHGGAVSYVEIETDQTDPVTQQPYRKALTGKKDMEEAITKHCYKHFWQASATPFLQEPLYPLVGDTGTTPASEDLLRGIIPDETKVQLLKNMRKYLKQLEQPPELYNVYLEFEPSLAQYQQSWKKQREKTSSCPPRHFGQLMAATQIPELAEIHRQLEFAPFLTGYSPSSWRRSIDVLIEKKPGEARVSKLRTIFLFDAVANHAFKHLGRTMMMTAEALQMLAPEQGGSRKRHQAIYKALDKVLTYDASRQFKLPLALLSCDARACYDRMVHAATSLSMQRTTVPKPPLVCMFTTIQKMEHHIRTVYGDSEDHFGGEKSLELYAVPLQTICQGNGAGPQMWAVVSTPLLNSLRAEGFGFVFKCVLTGEEVRFVGYSFVDDADFGFCDPTVLDYKTVARKMQATADLWHEGLHATGGALAPEKSFWYLLDYEWRQGQTEWSYKQRRACPATLEITDEDGWVYTLDRLSTSEARRTLGVYIAPNGSMGTQLKKSKEAGQAWAAQCATSKLPPHLAIQAFQSTIDRTLNYPLPVSSFSQQECREIQMIPLTAALRKAKIGKDFPIAARLGPVDYQGLGITSLYAAQLYSHLQAIIFGTEHPTQTTSHLLRMTSQALKMETGLNGPIFSHSFSTYGHLTEETWIQQTWKTCSEYEVSMLDDIPDFLPRRVNDILLTKAFATVVSKSDLKLINRCRLYLQVVYLSDITSADGASITLDAWLGRPSHLRATAHAWPHLSHMRFAPGQWDIWRSALTVAFKIYNGRMLLNPLGFWFDDECTIRHFYCRAEDRIYEQTQETTWRYYSKDPRPSRSRSSGGKHRYMLQDACPTPTDLHLQRATVWKLQDDPVNPIALRLDTTGHAIPRPVVTTAASSDLAALLNPEHRWIFDHLHVPSDNYATILQAIRSGTCLAISDGSYDPTTSTGAASMKIQGINGVNGISGQCATPGQPEDQSAYRSELTGMYFYTLTIWALCKLHTVHTGAVEFGCDGLSALNQLKDPSYTTDPGQEHFDIISATRHLMKDTNIHWTSRHVLGHQREKGPASSRKKTASRAQPTTSADILPDDVGFELSYKTTPKATERRTHFSGPLDRWAVLNDDCDAEAKQFRREFYSDTLRPMHQPMYLYKENYPITISGIKVARTLKQKLSMKIDGPPILKYWKKKNKFEEAQATDVDWKATGRAMRALPHSRRIHQSKVTTKFFANRYRMKLRGHSDEDTCPTCLAQEPPTTVTETAAHFLECPSTLEIWNTGISAMDEIMEKELTRPGIREAITNSLRAWRNKENLPSTQEADILPVLTLQHLLGWKSAFEGRFAIGWAALQDDYYKSLPQVTHKNGERWLKTIIAKLFDIAWDQWEHRNGMLHKHEEGIKARETRAKVLIEFEAGGMQNRHIRRLLAPGADRISRRPVHQMEEWLYHISLARSTQDYEEENITYQQTMMRNLFTRR